MKVAIVSDTHGATDFNTIISEHTPDINIHTGDSELKLTDSILEAWHTVKGNMDFDSKTPKIKLIEWQGERILIVHGHLQQVEFGLLRLQYLAAEHQATIVCFGHTHRLGAEVIEGRLFVNAGSWSFPRAGNPPTYAILSVTDHEWVINWYNQQHNEVESYKFNKRH